MQLLQENIDYIRDFLISEGFINVQTEHGHFISYRFSTLISREEIELRLIIQNSQKWTKAPVIQIINNDFSALDHVGNDGIVCTTDHQGENFSATNHIGLIKHFLNTAITIIKQSLYRLSINNRDELYNELEGYIATILEDQPAILLHENPESSNLFAWIKSDPKKPYLFLVDHVTGDNTNHLNHLINGELTKLQVHTILLKNANHFPIPNVGKSFNENCFEQLINALDHQDQKIISTAGKHIVLIGVPNKHGYAYILFSYSVWPLKTSIKLLSFNVSLVQRAWRNYLLNRTGQMDIAKHVAIIGCGALGSRIAEFLVQSGIQEISLIDDDILKSDNLYRHVLGLSAVNQSKAVALSRKLENERPGIVVHPYPIDAFKWLKSDFVDKVHTVILATGHFPTETEITRYLFDQEKSVNLISTWVEPYNLGGHILSFSTNTEGCLTCLFHDIQGDRVLYPLTSYIAENQHIAKNITGCAGAFTPFAAISSIKIASMVCDILLSNKKGLFSIAGDAELSNQEGIITTPYWSEVSKNQQQLLRSLGDIKIIGCPCCNI